MKEKKLEMNCVKFFWKRAESIYPFVNYDSHLLLGVLKIDRNTIVFLGHSVIYYRISR